MQHVARALIAGGVLTAHLLAAPLIAALTSSRHENRTSLPVLPALEVQVYVAQPDLDVVPIPEVRLRRIAVGADSLRLIRFDDPDAGDLSHVVGSTSAPQLSRVQIVEPDPYARRAGLSVGRPATVFLILEILADGSVGSISLSRSSGSAAADAAAADYAKQLRWIPGTIDRRAQTMRITFPITLAVRTD